MLGPLGAPIDGRADPVVVEPADVGHIPWAVVAAALPPHDDEGERDHRVLTCRLQEACHERRCVQEGVSDDLRPGCVSKLSWRGLIFMLTGVVSFSTGSGPRDLQRQAMQLNARPEFTFLTG